MLMLMLMLRLRLRLTMMVMVKKQHMSNGFDVSLPDRGSKAGSKLSCHGQDHPSEPLVVDAIGRLIRKSMNAWWKQYIIFT